MDVGRGDKAVGVGKNDVCAAVAVGTDVGVGMEVGRSGKAIDVDESDVCADVAVGTGASDDVLQASNAAASKTPPHTISCAATAS
jgi:hypothetical protein